MPHRIVEGQRHGIKHVINLPFCDDEGWTKGDGVVRQRPHDKAVVQRLIAAGKGGSIINIASILGHLAYPAFLNYGTTKGALIHMTRYMALDLLGHGIRVNAIAPGYFPSEMTNPFYESEAGIKEIANLPAKRLGRLEELDGPLLLLASDASSYMNGSVLTVDYGHSVRLS